MRAQRSRAGWGYLSPNWKTIVEPSPSFTVYLYRYPFARAFVEMLKTHCSDVESHRKELSGVVESMDSSTVAFADRLVWVAEKLVTTPAVPTLAPPASHTRNLATT